MFRGVESVALFFAKMRLSSFFPVYGGGARKDEAGLLRQPPTIFVFPGAFAEQSLRRAEAAETGYALSLHFEPHMDIFELFYTRI
jgi:hypothetical protein